MTTALPWPIALAQARALGHRPGPRRDFGMLHLAECSRCRAAMVENTSDGLGVTGSAINQICGKSKIDGATR